MVHGDPCQTVFAVGIRRAARLGGREASTLSHGPSNMNLSGTPGTGIREQSGTIAFIFGIFFINMLSRLGLAPLLPVLQTELALSHAEAGSVFLFISLGYGTGLFASTFTSARICHHQQIVVSSLAVGAAMMGLSRCETLWSLRLSLVALGIAGGLYLPSGVATLTGIVRRSDWGKVLAIHQLAPNLAYICSPLLAEVLMRWFSWQTVVFVYGLFSLSMGMALWMKGTHDRSCGDAPNLSSVGRLLRLPDLWILILLFSLAIGVNQGIFSMLPLYLTAERGMEAGTANRLLSISRLIAFGAPLAAGWFSDRLGLKKVLFATIVSSSLATYCIALVPGEWVGAGLAVQAVTSVCFFPLGFAALSSITSPGNRNLAVAFTVPFAHLFGAGMFPTLIGFAGDVGNFSLGLCILGTLTLAGAFLLRCISLNGGDG